MKILHIINDLGSGGAEKLVTDTLCLLKDNGCDVELLLLDDKRNAFDSALQGKNIKIHIADKRRMRSFKNIFFIRKVIKQGSFDAVHVHLFPCLYWASLAAKTIHSNRPKFVFTEHNTHNRRREKGIFKLLEKFIYSSYDIVTSISKATYDNLIKWVTPNEKSISKFVIVNNGIDVNKYSNAVPHTKHELLGIEGIDYLVCMIGRFSGQKDQETVIRAIDLLPDNVHLLLVGEGNTKQKCEELVKSLSLTGRVHFSGFRNDVERIYKTADLNVLSSKWEGFGLVAVEALASGKPFICSNVPGLADIVNGHCDLFEVGDYKELANLIRTHIDNRLCDSSNTDISFLNEYDINNYIIKLKNIYSI